MLEHPPHVLREAARAAFSFRRSALGYIQYSDWDQRLFVDAQRLVKVLEEMGFEPSSRVSAGLL